MFLQFFLVFMVTSEVISFNISKFSIRNIFNVNDNCYKDSFIFLPTSSDNSSEVFKVFNTGQCVKRLNEEKKITKNAENCPSGLVELSVLPIYKSKSSVSYPYATMNISLTVFSKISSIFVRLQCLHAENGEDVYCSNHTSMFHNGKHEWPCRAIDIFENEQQEINYPMRFAYSCFLLTSHSVYAINATILPQNCQARVVLTIPTIQQLYPDLIMDPEKLKLAHDPLWSPMLIADLSETDGIWLKIGKAENAYCETIEMNIYESIGNVYKFLESLSIDCPNTGIKWENVKKGNYHIVSYVPTRRCQLSCDESEKMCRMCPRTQLNLTIDKDRTTAKWRMLKMLKDSTNFIIGFSIILPIVLLIFAAGYVWCLRKKQENMAANPREIELSNSVKVLLIYADDCKEHSKCVTTFVECLRYNANAEVMFDVEQLNVPGVIPSRWLVDAFCQANKHLIFLSPCGVKMLDKQESETHVLDQQRPFPDIFKPSIEMVIRECTFSPTTALKKMGIIRTFYSPPVPRQLEVLGISSFFVPNDFAKLTAFLHDVEETDRYCLQQNLKAELAEELTKNAKEMEEVMKNPNWIQKRWIKKKEKEEEAEEELMTKVVSTSEEMDYEAMRKAAERLNLLPPDTDSEDEEKAIEKEKKKAEEKAKDNEEKTPFVLYELSESDEEMETKE